jgi:hypothetical protein
MDKKSAPTEGSRPAGGESLKWGVERRLEFIDFRLFWKGRINRADVMSRFDISAQQASTDLDRYAERSPGNIEYDRVQKTFVRGAGYVPTFSRGMGDRYLMQVQAMRLGWLEREQTWFDEPPRSEVVSLAHAPVEEPVLMAIVDAIRNRLELDVEYWTMSGKPAGTRRIAPHALAFSDRRWHARCWNEENRDFRDFNLTRMSEPRHTSSARIDPAHDLEWSTIATMRLVTNPRLPESTQAAVRREFGFDGDTLEIRTRLALLFYYREAYNLSGSHPNPYQQQLIFVNGDELEELRQSARRMSAIAVQGGAA